MKNRLLLVCVTVLGAPSISSAAEAVEVYKAKYIKTIVKILTPRMAQELKKMGKSDQESKKIISGIGLRLAECQVKLLQHYDKRYSNIAYATVVSGGSLLESNRKVESLMMADLESGKVTQEKIEAQLKKGIAVVTKCSKKVRSTSL